MSADTLTSWRKELTAAMQGDGDDGPVVAYAPNEQAFDVRGSRPRRGGVMGPGAAFKIKGQVQGQTSTYPHSTRLRNRAADSGPDQPRHSATLHLTP